MEFFKEMTRRKFMQSLTIGLGIATIVMLFALFFLTPPQENRSIIDMMIGTLIGAFGSAISFYFTIQENDNNNHTNTNT